MARLIRKDNGGTSEFDWNEKTARELGIRKPFWENLEAGEEFSTWTKSGGETRCVLTGLPDKPELIRCPTCGGKGSIEKPQTKSETRKKR